MDAALVRSSKSVAFVFVWSRSIVSLFVTRPTLKHYVATREELLWRAGEVLSAVADGELRMAIGGRYDLDHAADAYRDLEGRRTTGKLLIVP